MEYRFYSFVANNYLSPLQCGLQTAHAVHAVAQMSRMEGHETREQFKDWAMNGKTIVILAAVNHAGVLAVYDQLLDAMIGDDGVYLPAVVFREDEQSMNSMATACGVLVPSRLYDVVFNRVPFAVNGGNWVHNDISEPPFTQNEIRVIEYLKSFRLA